MQAKIGPIRLSEGVSRFNAATYLYACIICIGILAGLNFIQPYILSVVLEIPRSEQGTISGSLAFMQEIIAIILVSYLIRLAEGQSWFLEQWSWHWVLRCSPMQPI